MSRISRFAVTFAFALCSMASASPVLMEGIAAVVDGKPIMRSELMNKLYQFQEMPEAADMSDKQQKEYILEKLIEEKV